MIFNGSIPFTGRKIGSDSVANPPEDYRTSLLPSFLQRLRHEERIEYPPYSYKVFQKTTSIRLFHLLGCDVKSRTFVGCFSLLDFTDEDRPPYNALSYTWGSSIEGEEDQSLNPPWRVLCFQSPLDTKEKVPTQELQVSSIYIGNNLASYLGAVMSATERIGGASNHRMWIDALCINQEDDKEKECQLALMGEIYFKANKVVAWMGESTQYWQEFSWVSQVVSHKLGPFFYPDVSRIFAGYTPTSEEFWTRYFPNLNPPTGSWKLVWERFLRFLDKRRWFQRAWTYQEALLPKNLFIVCGSDYSHLRFEDLDYILVLLHTTGWYRALGDQFPHISKGVNPCAAVRQIGASNYRFYKRLGSSPSNTQGQANKGLSEAEWLGFWHDTCQALRSRFCSYEQDKINATIGIANLTRPDAVSLSLPPELSRMNAEEIYRWINTFFLRRLPDLRSLSHVGPAKLKKIQTLPSWCNDFSTILSSRPIAVFTKKSYPFDASGQASCQDASDVTIDGNRLILNGIRVCPLHIKSICVNKGLHEWCMNVILDMDQYKDTPEPGADALWRTLILDRDGNNQKPDSKLAREFTKWIEASYALNYLLPDMDDKLLEQRGTAQLEKWWQRCRLTIAQTAARGRFGGQVPQPTISAIKSIIGCVSSHPVWKTFRADMTRLVQNGVHPLQLLPTLVEQIPPLRQVCVNAYWGRFAGIILESTLNREYFLTTDGYLGVGCDELSRAKPDECWILQGGTVPYILRPHETERDTYTFVGDCYMHGIMYGEHLANLNGLSKKEATKQVVIM